MSVASCRNQPLSISSLDVAGSLEVHGAMTCDTSLHVLGATTLSGAVNLTGTVTATEFDARDFSVKDVNGDATKYSTLQQLAETLVVSNEALSSVISLGTKSVLNAHVTNMRLSSTSTTAEYPCPLILTYNNELRFNNTNGGTYSQINQIDAGTLGITAPLTVAITAPATTCSGTFQPATLVQVAGSLAPWSMQQQQTTDFNGIVNGATLETNYVFPQGAILPNGAANHIVSVSFLQGFASAVATEVSWVVDGAGHYSGILVGIKNVSGVDIAGGTQITTSFVVFGTLA